MNDSAQRDDLIRRTILVEGLANLAVSLAKLFAGLSTGSLAVLGDAIHSLTDFANNFVAWLVVRQSSRPADREHPYGHRKFEALAVFGLATLLAVLAFELALNALKREAAEVSHDAVSLGIMLSALIVNLAVALWERHWARRLRSDILHADTSHTFANILTTVVVIGGWQLSAMGYPWLDTFCALGVAALVMYLAFCLFKRAYPVLVDQIAIEPEPLIAEVRNLPGVREVRRVRSRRVGSTRVVDMIVTVDPDLSTAEGHQIADQVEAVLEEKFDAGDISIHIEPDI